MKLGILSDAHGHIEAFEIGLDVLRRAGAERIFYLGDAVGYIPEPAVAERLRALGIAWVKGNHEAMMLADSAPAEREAVYRLRETRAALSEGTLAITKNLKAVEEATIDGRRCLFVHGSPADPTHGYVYPDTPLTPFAGIEADAVFMGHTHRPFVRREVGKLFVNVGSCGLPRDGDPRGAACVFDAVSGMASILRFDIAEASRRALARYPLHETVAAALGRLAGKDIDA